MSVDCLLIHPAATHGIYGALGDTLTAVEPPLWSRLIAGYLLDKGWKVAICDMEGERLSPVQVVERAQEFGTRLVAICVYGHQPSASTQQMVGARGVADAFKNTANFRQTSNPVQRFKPIVVMLGNHPSALPERTLREEPVDYVIDGEGPVTLDALLRSPVVFRDVPGLVWFDASPASSRDVHPITRNPLAPLLDLDSDLHGRAWHLLPPLDRYRAHNWQCLDGWPRTPYAAIYTSLGCSYKCDFCMINVFQHTNKYRRRSPQAVIQEILGLYHLHGVRTFKIVDELFVLNRSHYREICQGVVEAGIGDHINVWAYARTDTVHPEDLPLMRAAGIRWLALGIESGSANVRAASNKSQTHFDASAIEFLEPDIFPGGMYGENAGIKATIRAIRAANINVIGNYIFGLPHDTRSTMRATLDLARGLNTEWANFYCAMPYPGSPLYDDIARGRPQDLPPSFEAYSQHNRYSVPLRNENLTAAEILAFRDNAHIAYFSNPNYRKMIEGKFGMHAIQEVDKMLSYKLERDLLK